MTSVRKWDRHPGAEGPLQTQMLAGRNASKQTASLQMCHLPATSCFTWLKDTIPVCTPAKVIPGIDAKPER